MKGSFARLVRDLHLYFGLFISPFLVAFSLSVFFLVHAWLPGWHAGETGPVRITADLPLPADLEQLSGRALIEALKPALAAAKAEGEVGWVQHLAKEHRLIIPVVVPGRTTTVTIDLLERQASVERRTTGWADALVTLHKSPGPHLAGIRMNWFPMRLWGWLADSTVYLLLLVSATGIYLWYSLRAERKVGLCLMAAGALSLFGMVYALAH